MIFNIKQFINIISALIQFIILSCFRMRITLTKCNQTVMNEKKKKKNYEHLEKENDCIHKCY